MPHFGSGNWPLNYGTIPYASPLSGFSKQVATLINTVATNTGVTEGTDKATFTVPDAGLYRVTAYMAVNVASDAGTETGQFVLTYTDAVGTKSAVDLNNSNASANTTLNLKTAAAVANWVGVFRALAAGSVVVAVKNVVGTSGRTVGSVNLNVILEKIGE
jgi:hypothetical protein